jgi:hypothetical protein
MAYSSENLWDRRPAGLLVDQRSAGPELDH